MKCKVGMLLKYFIISSNLLLFDRYSTPRWTYEGSLVNILPQTTYAFSTICIITHDVLCACTQQLKLRRKFDCHNQLFTAPIGLLRHISVANLHVIWETQRSQKAQMCYQIAFIFSFRYWVSINKSRFDLIAYQIFNSLRFTMTNR